LCFLFQLFIVCSAAIKIGDDILEIRGGVEDRRYWVNGVEGKRFRASRNLPFTIGGHHGRFRAVNRFLSQYRIYLPNHQNVTIKSNKNMLRVDLDDATIADFGWSRGLMGSFGDGLMIGRDNRTVINEPNEFGQEWQVLSTEPQLFHEVDGPQHPQTCTMPMSQPEEARRLLLDSISRSDAEEACAVASRDEWEDCVFDVMATNDMDMAGTYA